jgi:hypothetical protein
MNMPLLPPRPKNPRWPCECRHLCLGRYERLLTCCAVLLLQVHRLAAPPDLLPSMHKLNPLELTRHAFVLVLPMQMRPVPYRRLHQSPRQW